MTRTVVLDPTALPATLATAYTLTGGGLTTHERIGVLAAAGNVASTVTDLAKYAAALDTGQLFRPSTLEQMATPEYLVDGADVPYGFG